MKVTPLFTAGLLLGTVASGLLPLRSALAADLHWSYTRDSFNDGYGGGILGAQSAYEIYGAGVAQDSGYLYFAFNANMPLTGTFVPGVSDSNVGWGDLLLNFTGQSLLSASSSGNLYGIRFAATNDSGVTGTGVWQGVTATSVTSTNSGFNSLSSYNNAVLGAGGIPSLGAFAADDTTYFDQTAAVLNVMATGTKVGEITLLTQEVLTSQGLNFATIGATGSQTIGFKVSKADLPTGNFIASLFMECANDGVALQSAAVPEPTTMAGLALAGGGLTLLKRRRQRQ